MWAKCHVQSIGALTPIKGPKFKDSNNVEEVVTLSFDTCFVKYQLNDCLNSRGEGFVFVLNNLLNDCECSKPNRTVIKLMDSFLSQL